MEKGQSRVKNTYTDFRQAVILRQQRLQAQADLGWDVLDASVEVAAVTLAAQPTVSPNLFFDVSKRDLSQRDHALLKAIESAREGTIDEDTFECTSDELYALPNSVLAFQFPDFLRRLFASQPNLADQGFKAFMGHSVKSDRYFRLRWEIGLYEQIGFNTKMWTWLFNGGEYYPFYNAEYNITVYGYNGSNLAPDKSIILRNVPRHGMLSVGYGKRGEFIDAQVVPPGHVFTVEGEGSSVLSEQQALYFVSLLNSSIFQYGINLYSGQHKYPGYVNLFPCPHVDQLSMQKVTSHARQLLELKRLWQTSDETDIVFSQPWHNQRIDLGFISWIDAVLIARSEADNVLSKLNTALDQAFKDIYRINDDDWSIVIDYCKRKPRDIVWFGGPKDGTSARQELVNSTLSYCLGIVFGRWDARIGKDLSLATQLGSPFDQLPVCAAGALTEDAKLIAPNSSLPYRPERLPAMPEDVPANYPLPIQWSGILVDDEGHLDDISTRVRSVLAYLFDVENDQAIEAEIISLLQESSASIKSLHDYYTTQFFGTHIKKYSKSRRKAPIYWQLASRRKSYSLWLYYHRLHPGTLYQALQEYVEPKIELEQTRLRELEAQQRAATDSRAARNLAGQVDRKAALVEELIQFGNDLKEAADHGFAPDLNDGVILNIAPLHKLVPWPDAATAWKELQAGKYPWSTIGQHLAGTHT